MLKEVEQADADYLFAYLLYYASSSGNHKKNDFRIFQQLVFMSEFGNKSQSGADSKEDAIDI